MAMLEEQQVVIEVQGVSPLGGNPLMDNSWLGRTTEITNPRISFASAVPLHVCCCCLSLMSGMVELGVGGFPLFLM